MKSFLVLALLLLGSGAVASDTPDNWQAAGERDGVDMWTRPVPGTKVREIKASTIVAVPAERIWSVLTDIERYPEFMPYMVETRILERQGPDTAYVYQCVAPPVVARRDSIVEVRNSSDDRMGIYMTAWKSVDDRGVAPRDHIVRLSDVRGQWVLERLTENQARLTYTLFTEPGGSVPSWVANRANQRSAPKIVKAVSERAAAL